MALLCGRVHNDHYEDRILADQVLRTPTQYHSTASLPMDSNP